MTKQDASQLPPVLQYATPRPPERTSPAGNAVLGIFFLVYPIANVTVLKDRNRGLPLRTRCSRFGIDCRW
jgi:hypothetical protein